MNIAMNCILLMQIMYTKPAYIFNGLSLAVHDFHTKKITIKDYKFDGINYSGTLHYEFNDHYGLDSKDLDITFGFVDWFIFIEFNY